MDDPQDNPVRLPDDGSNESPTKESSAEIPAEITRPLPVASEEHLPEIAVPPAAIPSFAYVGVETPRQRNLRNNLFTLLGLGLASFVLTAWVLVRIESPFGIFSSGPNAVVSAQLRALDRGQMRAAYDMFSAQYREKVTFNQWRELVVTHWRLFHAEVLRTEQPEQSGQRATQEIHLRGADSKAYRARFTLIRAQGRWWVDDLRWTAEADERNMQRI
jgi:hypothetical protein